eukprot:CAMPEP_0206427590 /NCGR_PEP_ID=MMETSP0324_2-20121206/5131_1 /ASSEMBLY_ACC=CAM_ASM_000836 /TAXON_ID=2866 /ORGANISM="Crypthecodinium cohnii, Strain Seligo" /LENGTH=235 /DNA_ID=CAMNT_0053892899 /DNA_START=332 /DNA_END=1040 /DNA_ORIENTATION=-
MAAQITHRGPRLAVLLRSFGLSPAELAKQEPKAAITALRTRYKQLAKEQHPDVAPEGMKEQAAEKFVLLQGHFEEAVETPGGGNSTWGAHLLAVTHSLGRGKADLHRAFLDGARQPFQHQAEPQFDTKTRVKGHVVLWSSLFLFLAGMREFMVWSAGSTYAWKPPTDLNPFWVRRFADEWHDTHKQKVETPKAPPKPAVQELRRKQDRGVSTFYQKRGISNARRKTEPRGLGPSL